MFDELRQLIVADEDSKIDKLPADSIESIQQEYPDIPGDYLEYLRVVGWGTIGECYVVYGSPKPAKEILGHCDNPAVESLVLFGDDMTGRFAGFDTKNWKVVEVLHDKKSTLSEWGSFAEFIQHICAVVLAVDSDKYQ